MNMPPLIALLIVCLSGISSGQRPQLSPEQIERWKERFENQKANQIDATESDIAYGKHERNRLDLWKAKSRTPTPVLVYFHGGGFKFGDKDMIHAQIRIKDYLDNGASCISVNYPFLQDTGNDYEEIFRHCDDALDFILKHADEWNIDPKRISFAGASAGAAISQRIGYSSRKVHSLVAFNQPMMTERMILPHVRRGGPPTFIYHDNGKDDRMHPPECAKMLKKACDKHGIECHLYGTGDNTIEKIPNRKSPEAAVLEFFLEKWK
jgi:acetyl esterase/lipase